MRGKSPSAAQRIHANVVFQAPTIKALTGAVLAVVHNSPSASSGGNTAEDLVRIAEEYASDLPARPAALRKREVGKDVILITGTTGGFGCDVLEHLLRDDNVAKVYAFNRRGTQALERQLVRFRERGLDETLLSSPKFVMVEGVLDAPGFGLEATLLDEVPSLQSNTRPYAQLLTLFIDTRFYHPCPPQRYVRLPDLTGLSWLTFHAAWTVNFVLSLRSFETDLRGTRNLIDLALSSPYSEPPRILFISSIGVFTRAFVCSGSPFLVT